MGVVVLGGLVVLGARPYYIARYRGKSANLRGAVLVLAPLAGADLVGANLRRVNLREADLRGALLLDADLQGADLRGANLQGTALDHLCDLVTITVEEGPTGRPVRVVSTHGLDPNLRGARYDRRTRWPAGFDPVRAGAVLVR